MKINNCSFKGGYRETSIFIGNPNLKITEALSKARPYLKQIGYSMPGSRELIVHMTKDKGNTILSAYDRNFSNGKSTLLAVANQHNIEPNGINFVTRILKSLEIGNKRDFNKIAVNFVKHLSEFADELCFKLK